MKRLPCLLLGVLAVLWALAAPARAIIPNPGSIYCNQAEDCRQLLVLKAGYLPIDLTGYSFQAQVRASYADPVPLAEFQVDLSGAAKGQVLLVLPQAVTATLGGKTGIWDLRQTDLNGVVSYLVRGPFKCLYSATRP